MTALDANKRGEKSEAFGRQEVQHKHMQNKLGIEALNDIGLHIIVSRVRRSCRHVDADIQPKF